LAGVYAGLFGCRDGLVIFPPPVSDTPRALHHFPQRKYFSICLRAFQVSGYIEFTFVQLLNCRLRRATCLRTAYLSACNPASSQCVRSTRFQVLAIQVGLLVHQALRISDVRQSLFQVTIQLNSQVVPVLADSGRRPRRIIREFPYAHIGIGIAALRILRFPSCSAGMPCGLAPVVAMESVGGPALLPL